MSFAKCVYLNYAAFSWLDGPEIYVKSYPLDIL